MTDGVRESFRDERVLALANEVSKAVPALVPRLLLQIQNILDAYKFRTSELPALKKLLWEYELPVATVAALKHDLSRILDGWNVAQNLSSILVSCSVGYDPDDQETFQNQTLPDVLETVLMVASKIQKRYIKTSLILEDTRNQLLANFRGVFESLSYLLAGFKHLASSTLQSAWFLQMLLTDDVTTGVRVMSLLQSLNRSIQGLLGQIETKIANQILDELVYKLSATTSSEIASSAAHSLLIICESHPPAIQLVLSRYKGLKMLLTRWVAAPFVRDLERLVDTGGFKQAAMLKFSAAAMVIQSWWKSYRTRKQLKKADSALSQLQRSFRMRKEYEKRKRENTRAEKELQHMLLMQRKYTMRQLHKRQLQALDIVPASQISKHLLNEQTRAALKIQAIWKGHRSRRGLETKRCTVKRVRAAVKIQRAVRRWLERVRSKKEEMSSWHRPPGLTDARRVELQEKIKEWREVHQVAERTREEQELLHNDVQNLIKCNIILSKAMRRKQQHREALLGTINLDANLLLNAPTLSIVTESDVATFACKSVPIAAKARQTHAEHMLLLQQPWWRKLRDEYQDSEYTEESDSWKVF